MLSAIGQAAAEAGIGFALILDEVQNLGRDDYEALIMALHRAKQKGLPIAFVGAGLPLIPALTAQAKSYAERMFVYPTIGVLADTDAREALVLPAQSQGVEWDEAALRQALSYTEGYPYFLNRSTAGGMGPELGSAHYRCGCDDSPSHSRGRPGRELLRGSYRTPHRYREAVYGRDRRVGRRASIERGRGASTGPHHQVRVPQRDALIDSAVIYAPRHGYVDFTVPHCAAFDPPPLSTD